MSAARPDCACAWSDLRRSLLQAGMASRCNLKSRTSRSGQPISSTFPHAALQRAKCRPPIRKYAAGSGSNTNKVQSSPPHVPDRFSLLNPDFPSAYRRRMTPPLQLRDGTVRKHPACSAAGSGMRFADTRNEVHIEGVVRQMPAIDLRKARRLQHLQRQFLAPHRTQTGTALRQRYRRAMHA